MSLERSWRVALPALLLLAGAAWSPAQNLQPIPRLEARVTDLTGTLTAAQQSSLEEKLAAFEARKGSQIAVLLVPTTRPEEIEQYSIRVVDEWRLGREKPDDGALLIIAKDDRRLRIEVGRGLEGALTDATSKRIIAETITPLFRQGDFFGGINAGLDQMIRVIDGEPLPEPDRRWEGEPPPVSALMLVLFFVVPVLAMILPALLGRPLGALATGGLAGGLAWVLSKLWLLAIGLGLFGFLFALASRSRSGWASTPRHAGWGGFGGFGGGLGRGGFGGGFGGGGFRGGGGSFGGGGASGSW